MCQFHPLENERGRSGIFFRIGSICGEDRRGIDVERILFG